MYYFFKIICKISICIGLFYIIGCKNDLSLTKRINEKANSNEEIATDIVVEYSENALPKARLIAPKMVKRMDTANKSYFPDGLLLEMYNTEGKLSSTLSAKQGEMDHTTQQMKAKDSVSVVSSNGQKLFGNELIWNQNTRLLTTTGSVKIQTPNEIIYGDTLTADENLRVYTIKKVRGIIQVKK